MTLTLDAACDLDPQVALRPERFGALAYHYGTRRLVFLRSPDIVQVVEALGSSPTVGDALRGSHIAEPRWPSFLAALDQLHADGVVRARTAENSP